MNWKCTAETEKPSLWHLNIDLLEARGMKEEMTVKIQYFFEVNQRAADDVVVSETFRVYFRGEFISLNAARQKARNTLKKELQKIEDLDQE